MSNLAKRRYLNKIPLSIFLYNFLIFLTAYNSFNSLFIYQFPEKITKIIKGNNAKKI